MTYVPRRGHLSMIISMLPAPERLRASATCLRHAMHAECACTGGANHRGRDLS